MCNVTIRWLMLHRRARMRKLPVADPEQERREAEMLCPNMDLALHASAHHGALSSSPQVLQSILVDEASACPGFVGIIDAHDFPNPAANDGVGSLTNTTPRSPQTNSPHRTPTATARARTLP